MTQKKPCIANGDLPAKTAIFELQSTVEAIAENAALYEGKNFEQRIESIDFLGFQVLDQIEALLQTTARPGKLALLKYRAEKLKAELEEIDNKLFQQIREKIRSGVYTGTAFKSLVNEYISFNAKNNEHREDPGYDNLDSFINGLFPLQTMPEQTKDLEPEMVYYQKTPARIVFELVEKSHFRKEDVFFDLGAGLGQPAILVNLLAGIRVEGVEFEPAFCGFARDCARALNLSKIRFINADARKADYSEGTVFFMFTPFKGEILEAVLDRLRKESLQRKIKIFTYGPCTARLTLQNWLRAESPKEDSVYTPGVFSSV